MPDEALRIVLVEDDDGHAELTRRQLARAGVTAAVLHFRDGQVALDYLRREGAYSDRPAGGPLLVLLDIFLPGLDGEAVLRRLKADNQTAPLPVVMLTAADDEAEAQRCYALGCAAYLVKPASEAALAEAVRRLALFLGVVRLPKEGP